MILRVLRRRWYVTVAGLLATVMAAYFVLGVLPSQYQAKQSVVLLPAAASPTKQAAASTPQAAAATANQGDPNPYRGFDSSISVTAEVMSASVTQPSVVKRLVAQGASSSFGATVDQQSGGPVLQITASSDKPAVAKRTVALVTQELRNELANRQRAVGAPSDSWITISDVTAPGAPQQMIKGKIRILIALGVLGVAGTVAAALAFDALARARSGRKQTSRDDPPESPRDGDTDGDEVTWADLEHLIAAGSSRHGVERAAG
jgi:hypothetical protein